jgi:tetratricopeptide (TPR) repeat protein
MKKAYENRDRLTEKERLWTEGAYHMGRGETEEALNAYLTLLEMEPERADIYNNIGVLYNLNRQTERALEYFEQSRELEPTSFNVAFNIVVNNIELGNLAEARAENERFAETSPDHPIYHVNRLFIAFAEFDYETAREAIDTWAAYGDQAGAALVTSTHLGLAGVRGRIAAAESALEQSGARAASGRQVREHLLDAIGTGLFEIGALDDVERGIMRVETALESFPLSNMEPFDRPYLELAEFFARAGLTTRARLMLSQYAREVPEEFRLLTVAEFHRANAFLALAEGRAEEALESFLLSDQGSCTVCVLPGLARVYEQTNNSDSLLAVLERYVTTPDDDRFNVDAIELPGALVRLGELHEARGNRAKAVEYYDRFVNLWENADAELQPQVQDIRRRIARLTAENVSPR